MLRLPKFGLATALLFAFGAEAQQAPASAGTAKTPFTVDDLVRLAAIDDLDLSPDGETVVYSVGKANFETDDPRYDLWRARFDGSDRRRLTHTPDHDEYHAVYSPDGKRIAFLSDREEDDGTTQVWVMPTDGGEAAKLTDYPGDVSDFDWSPDGRFLAVIASDPESSDDEEESPKPDPIVIDRYQFKEDFIGLLTEKRQHLYLFEIAGKKSTQLTSGQHDEYLPAWSPDGKRIAYVTKRGPDPDRHINWDIYVIEPRAGAEEKQVTQYIGADLDPYWETRPAWSSDSRRIAYLQSGEDKWIYYKPWELAIVDVETGKSSRPAVFDRNMGKPVFTPDGQSVLVLIEESRVTHVSRVDLATGRVTPITLGKRFDYDFDAAANGRIAVLGGDDWHPYRIEGVTPEVNVPSVIADHNEWLQKRRLAPVEPIEFRSADGTPIEGFLVKPLDYEPGKRYPTILRIHGGPVYQFSHEFMEDWQVYAANGFAVVAANPRGSSGRGFDFASAIYADWGNKDTADVLAAVDHVVKMGVADSARLGIGGHSYGGILTDSVIARDTRFKAAIASAGASNMYGTYGFDMYTREYELELGLPWRDRAAYDRVSFAFFNADRITTPTLFLCEELDENVPCIGSMQMYQALRTLNVPTRLVIYPGEYHPVTIPSYLRDRMNRSLDWYARYLGVLLGK
jgi:dipeptidyl aminopeptidase/acylaminoacyl peptidase